MSVFEQYANAFIKEYDFLCSRNEWNSLFQRIKNNASTKMSDFECLVARSNENRIKNTYREVVPYDFNRVILSKPFHSDTDYINASNVRLHGRSYITTQYPDRRTVHLFWSMAWQSKSQGIIMLGRLYEDNGVNYFPGLNEEMIVYNPMNVEEKLFVVYADSEVSYDGFIQRKLQINNIQLNETMELMHFEFWSWPDQGVPQCMQSFLTLFGLTRQYNIVNSTIGPPIIHCSAGAGRTGTFCLIDLAIVMAEKDGNLDNINIPELMEELRCQRMGMIRSFAQLRFCYEAVIEAFRKYCDSTHEQLDGSYLLSLGEPHNCINDNIKAPSSSSCSDDVGSDVVMYIANTDESEEMNENDDYSVDFSRRNSLEASEVSDHESYGPLNRQEVINARKRKTQQTIALLEAHLKANNLKRFRFLSTSLTLFDELKHERYRSMLLVVGAVVCMGTFYWLKYCPSKCS